MAHRPEFDEPTLERVTPTTSDLLTWWFGAERASVRARLGIQAAHQRAILETIVAHETRETEHGYGVAPGHAVAAHHHCHGVELVPGSGRTAVLLALLVWQVLNQMRAQTAGRDDPRFTRHFLVVAPGLIAYERLLDALCGTPIPGGHGARDFGSADLARFADFFLPPAWHHPVFAFVCGRLRGHREIGVQPAGDGLLALAHRRLLLEGHGMARGAYRSPRSPALRYLAQLPELMVFDDEAPPIPGLGRGGCTTDLAWQACLHRIAASKGRRFAQVSFVDAPPDP